MSVSKKTALATRRRNGVAKKGEIVAPVPVVIPPLTASALKDALWETLNRVQQDDMTPGRADSIAVGAREILRTVNTQLRVAAQGKRGVPKEVIDFSEN